MGTADFLLCFGLLAATRIAYGYTLLESTQIVEGKCMHEGKLMDHDEIIRKDDTCESYRCDAHRKTMLVDLCHYGLYQKAPPGCVLRKRSGDFPACCPWPDCSAAESIAAHETDSFSANGTITDEPLTDVSGLIIPASQLDTDKQDSNETPPKASDSSLHNLSSTTTNARSLSGHTEDSDFDPVTTPAESAS
ncbi:uncharacterized protein LOC142590707 isoform X1 [Dermacentor variabilis]|uniref:uncharacterized protein LOC142590707 isoform X1 n=1 Tax=Dermacentor variabilis TaxID=34621 RepID=UPI003F5BF3D5